MAVIVGSARSDENRAAHGGKAGDQTGKEVCTQNWYLNDKGWYVLRARSPEAREKIARTMELACADPRIGYDQYQRDTLYNAVKDHGFDLTKLEKNVECDCSALVRVCMAYAGIMVNSFRTSNQVSVTMATGRFEKFTDDLHCKKSTNLLRGDILVTHTQGHTVVVLSDGSDAARERGGGEEPARGKQVRITGSSVNIRVGNGTQYSRILTAKKNTAYPYVATAENGWNAVVVNGQVGWVSGNYSAVE